MTLTDCSASSMCVIVRLQTYCYVHCSVHSNEAAKTPVASKSDFQGTAIFSGKYHFTDNISMRGPGDMGLINMVPIVRTMIVHVTGSGVQGLNHLMSKSVNQMPLGIHAPGIVKKS